MTYEVPDEGLERITEAGSSIALFQRPSDTTPEGWEWVIFFNKPEESDGLELKLSEDAFNSLVLMKSEFDFLTRGIG